MVYVQKQNQMQAGCNTLMSMGDCTPARGLALETNGTQVKDLAKVDYSDRRQSTPATGWGTNNGHIELDTTRIVEVSSMGFGPRGLSAGGFVIGDGSISGGDTGRSPGTTSNGLTSNSTTPSESHQSKTTHVSHGFGISPSATSQQQATTTTDFFSVGDAFSGVQGGDPLGNNNGGATNGFEMQENEWQMGGDSGSGMTPIGPGVFRHLLDLGIDNMYVHCGILIALGAFANDEFRDIGLDGY